MDLTLFFYLFFSQEIVDVALAKRSKKNKLNLDIGLSFYGSDDQFQINRTPYMM